MGKNTLKLLIENKIFDPSDNETGTLVDTIWKKEIEMSRILIRNGHNIGCLLPYYKDVDFVNLEKNKNITFLGDVMAPVYLNKLWKPEDVIFMKGNRFEDVDLSSYLKK